MNSWLNEGTDANVIAQDGRQPNQFPVLGIQNQASQQASQQQPAQPPAQAQPQPPLTHVLPPGLPSTGSRANTPVISTGQDAASATPTASQTAAAAAAAVQPAPPQEDDTEIPDIDKFGLKGLLSTIKMENVDQIKFTIGTDVNMLGLDFAEEKLLSTKFETPWPEIVRTEVEPEFNDTDFANLPEQKLTEETFVSLSDETLFFIFYTRPNHFVQELASRQLNSRNWRFHKDLQLWLTKDSTVDPIQQNNQSERGIYIFFDPNTWEKVKKEFVLHYASLHQAAV